MRKITKGHNLHEEFQRVQGSQEQDEFEMFARQSALLIKELLVSNLTTIEEICGQMTNSQELEELVNQGLTFMVQCFQCEEDELRMICLEFWEFFTEHVDKKNKDSIDFTVSSTYEPTIKNLRQIMMEIMEQPEEVMTFN